MHVHNNIPIDYIAYNSGIRNWNTGFKLLFALLSIIVVIASDNFYIAVYTFIFMGVVNIRIAKLPARTYLAALEIPAVFILLGGVAISVCFSKEPHGIYSIGAGSLYIYITRESLREMSDVILKAFGAVSAMYLVTLSTPVCEIASVLEKMHFPDIFTSLMYLVYRYIFILLDGVRKMRNAGEARLGYVDFRTACHSFSMMLGNLLVVSLENSRTYFDAMEARCYNGSIGFYTEKKELTKLQAAVMAVYFIPLIITAFLEYLPWL